MMRPPPVSFIIRAACCVQRKQPFKLVSSIRSQDSSSTSSEGQTKSGPFICAARSGFHLMERVEDGIESVLRNADAGVRDDQARRGFGGRIGREDDLHVAAKGELDGVLDEVLDDLRQAIGVERHQRRVLRNNDAKAQTFRDRGIAVVIRNAVYDRDNVRVLEVQLGLSATEV